MTTTITRGGPKLSTDQLDHIDLWKYFESRGQDLKTAMLSLVTWLTGFAGAVLAFALKEGMNFKTPGPLLANAPLSGLLGLLGLGIVVYAHVIIYEYADHINRTFDRSDKVRSLDTSLDVILGPWQTHPPRMPAICRHARNVMRAFGTAFLLLLVTAVVSLSMRSGSITVSAQTAGLSSASFRMRSAAATARSCMRRAPTCCASRATASARSSAA